MNEVPANPFAVRDGRPPNQESALTPSDDVGASPYGQPPAGVPAYGTPTYGSPHDAPPYGSYAPPSYGPSAIPYPPSYGSFPPPYGPAYAAPRSTNGLAVASMVVGIVSIALCAFIAPAVVGLVLGIVALNQTKGDSTGGRGMAVAGVATSAVSLALAAVFIVIGLAADDSSDDGGYGRYSTQGQVTGDALTGHLAA